MTFGGGAANFATVHPSAHLSIRVLAALRQRRSARSAGSGPGAGAGRPAARRRRPRARAPASPRGARGRSARPRRLRRPRTRLLRVAAVREPAARGQVVDVGVGGRDGVGVGGEPHGADARCVDEDAASRQGMGLARRGRVAALGVAGATSRTAMTSSPSRAFVSDDLPPSPTRPPARRSARRRGSHGVDAVVVEDRGGHHVEAGVGGGHLLGDGGCVDRPGRPWRGPRSGPHRRPRPA